ncbi:putative translation release factor [Thermochaetoides thermophila DSM 1495]|uniref:Putative translation release factor n=1 Tax=Chaetomium thermophilum (strain DSM 1495 / CBS 144.50 / IMI 039719) TaxID=759272 RepID=G0S272_CHATD|nr:putative translation release factor [Thermochaetoides thermophila DSM 1495]EGS22105.1 putative translation release factor [Thermochaetoides thermophila DSM 1495]
MGFSAVCNRGCFLLSGTIQRRLKQHKAFDADFDKKLLEEARKWKEKFTINQLPQGQTTYARSSGPGGQHVNKTETKAITAWPLPQLLSYLPKIMHDAVRQSKYYSKRSDALVFQAQTERSRSLNEAENMSKLWEEIQAIYRAVVPNETSPDKYKKYAELEKKARESRLQSKKAKSAKKAARRGSDD